MLARIPVKIRFVHSVNKPFKKISIIADIQYLKANKLVKGKGINHFIEIGWLE